MAWTIEFDKKAQRELKNLDVQTRHRIINFLHERLATMDNPRNIGEALVGTTLGHLWKYRVGDYRVIADIQDERVCILVVRIGNRRDIYKHRS